MLPRPVRLPPSIDTAQGEAFFGGSGHSIQSGLTSRIGHASQESNETDALTEDCENRGLSTSSLPPKLGSSSNGQGAQSANRRGILIENNRVLMTPTGLVSTPAPSLPSNWYELAIKARTAALRDSQRNMSAPTPIPSDSVSETQAGTTSVDQDVAAPQLAAIQASDAPMIAPEPTPEVKTEPIVETLLQPDTLPHPTAEASLPNQPLAGGLIGESSTTATQPIVSDAVASAPSVPQPIIAALTNTNASRVPPSEGADALRTEIMGPPPSLPADPAYPPLNPVISDAPVLAPTNHKRRGASGVNGTQRKSYVLQAPVDYVAPVNINGKMPYALFQTIKRTSPLLEKASTETAVGAERSHSVSTSSDAGIVSKEGGVPSEVPVTSESSAVDPLVADVLTDADSVATATATRETSPDAAAAAAAATATAQHSVNEVGAPGTRTSQSPAINDEAALLSAPVVSDSTDSIPAASMLSAVDVGDAATTPIAAMRRNPSNRGASLLASQSISSAYADPLGLKKHRELQLQEEARARRSPSASSAGAGPAASTASAGAKKSSGAARTIVPPPLVEPPPGMMHTSEGKLRTIPGIAGAIVPPGPSSTSTDTNLSPRLEDKGSVNNDFCETCGGHGRFVCCDGCPRSFHFHCMSPPLDIDEMPASNAAEVLGPAKSGSAQKAKSKAGTPGPSSEINTDEMWFCNVCVAERKPKAVQKPKGLGPFGQLLPLLSLQNPKSFQLPADVRTYFKDVATANDGDYVNGGMLRQVKPNKHGLIEARDPYRLKDKNGDTVLCYRCGGTALPAESTNDDARHTAASAPAEHTIREGTGWRKIVSCDFCPLHWHIDCVDPPMLGMPSNLRRWMCPAHSDHVNDRRRIARVGAAVPKTLDLPIPSAKTIGPGKHFRTRVLNNGDIDIIPDPMELLMGGNGITGSLQSGVKDVPVVPGVVDSPALTAGGSKLASKIRFRFPEKVIRTDFWSKVRGDQTSKIGDVFYVAAEELANRVPTRLIALEDGVAPGDDSRYRPFGKRDHALSGLDALADIASSRLKGEDLPLNTGAFAQPSRTRHLIHTALGIDLSSDDIPESSIRASLTDLDSSESPLSSLSDSDEPTSTPLAPSTTTALSEEEQIKRLTAAAASAVSSGDPPRLSKRKAAVAAESAIAGSPAKKPRSASPTPVPVAVEVRPTGGKKITLKATLTESQAALRTAHHLAEQHAEERREMEQLRAVRELMRVKGVGRLMEFLLSPNE